MKAGQASRTAVMVCEWRALAHGRSDVASFADPTALTLLPADARARVERVRAVGELARLVVGFDFAQAYMMAARTLAIDESVRAATRPQLVILGAGLDGRAHRMPELHNVAVFEVDHPDTQQEKRARAGSLPQLAGDLRYVSVDFTRDKLAPALAGAGHDPGRPTTWIWEGVVMYLTRQDIEQTLAVIAERSCPGSRLIVLYHSPAAVLHVVSFALRMFGEPFRSTLTPAAMATLLGKYGFHVQRDRDLFEIGAALSQAMRAALRLARHARVVTADKEHHAI